MGRARETAFQAVAFVMMCWCFCATFTSDLPRKTKDNTMKRKRPPVVYVHDVDDPAAKFIGMDVPRGCGCSPWLFLIFVVLIILGSIFSPR